MAILPARPGDIEGEKRMRPFKSPPSRHRSPVRKRTQAELMKVELPVGPVDLANIEPCVDAAKSGLAPHRYHLLDITS